MTRGTRRLKVRPSRARRIALVAAPLVTVAAVATGVASSSQHLAPQARGAQAQTLGALDLGKLAGGASLGGRELSVSRDFDRMAIAGASNVHPPKPAGHRWTTATLDLRTGPSDNARVLDEIGDLEKVTITGREVRGFAEVLVQGKARWVTAEYLVKDKPDPQPADLPLADQPCAGTSGVESGLVPDAVRVYRAVCNNFPQITSYGGWDAHGEHSSGKAIDIMTSDTGLGTAIAQFLQAHAGELNLYDIIWQQHIWTPVRAAEGWRSMPDRGSATANHYDHVHVSVN